MANKILADLGLSPLSKFLLVYWFSLGFIVLDQYNTFTQQWIPIITGQPLLNPDGSVGGLITITGEPIGFALGFGASLLILYGAYLLYNKKKQGAQIAIAANVVSVLYFVVFVAPNYNFQDVTSFVAVYLVTFIVMVAGPVLLFPDEYS